MYYIVHKPTHTVQTVMITRKDDNKLTLSFKRIFYNIVTISYIGKYLKFRGYKWTITLPFLRITIISVASMF